MIIAIKVVDRALRGEWCIDDLSIGRSQPSMAKGVIGCSIRVH